MPIPSFFFTGNPVINLPFGTFNLFDLIVLGVIILLTVFFITTTISHGVALSKSDQAARQNKQWAESDQLRSKISDLGWSVKDTPSGPQLERS